MQQYVEVLCQEIAVTHVEASNGLQTIFFGGGTPSLIPPSLLAGILQQLRSTFGICKDAEISMEADPGTFTEDTFKAYMSLGVNRFSIGIQAFQQDVLEHCGRSHNLADVYKALEDIRRAGVENWSLDLISGLPHCSLEAWKQSMQEALQAQPTHISVYDLQVEDKTKFGRLYSSGQFPLPTDENTAAMFCIASEMLRAAGMEHYEISSYAKPGYRCRHNQVYWSGKPYYAFGVGAASYIQGRRFSRPRSMSHYKKWVAELVSGDSMPAGLADSAEAAEDRLLDKVMLRLRLADGLHLGDVQEEFGQKQADLIKEAIKPHVEKTVDFDGQTICLKDPQGYLFSNDIISDIFARLDTD